MNFWVVSWAFFVFVILVMISLWSTKSDSLKEKIKENYDLQDANYILREKIDDLKEENNILKKEEG